jgi:PKD repeat protein
MSFTYIRRAAVALALIATAGCTVKSTETPPLNGPSGLALSLTVNAIPDSISQDGGSQSSVRVTAIGPDGRGVSGLALRLDMVVGGVAQDYGTLSARSVVTNGDGVATAVYTAPPSPVNGLFGTCSGLPGNCVSIVATATSTNFTTANPERVEIRLVPTGVIQPPAGLPTAQFTISPTPVNFNIPSTFDASTSLVGTGASAIVSYSWNFGDGGTATGKSATHTYVASTTPATSFNVVLTVVNDRGLTASTTQTIPVSASPPPTGDWVFSPTTPVVGDVILFNADGLRAAAGHTLVGFSWNFGDQFSASSNTASGFQATHAYTVANNYTVVLTVTDDAGQKTTLSKVVTVGSGGPTARFTFAVTDVLNHVVTVDGSGSTATGTAAIKNYSWTWGDGASTDSGGARVASHPYAAAGSYVITLTVTDSLNRVGSLSQSVTVP